MDHESGTRPIKQVRHDMWGTKDDRNLANIVLSAMRSGETQLRAFERAGAKLGRTAGACGFRWNGVLRHQHNAEIEAAKRERFGEREKTTHPTTYESVHATSTFAMREAIDFLQRFDRAYQDTSECARSLAEDCRQLTERVTELEQRATSAPAQPVSPEQLQEDAKHLLDIVIRARGILSIGKA